MELNVIESGSEKEDTLDVDNNYNNKITSYIINLMNLIQQDDPINQEKNAEVLQYLSMALAANCKSLKVINCNEKLPVDNANKSDAVLKLRENDNQYGNLPTFKSKAFVGVNDVSEILGISVAKVREIFARPDFPKLNYGKRDIVSLGAFMEYASNGILQKDTQRKSNISSTLNTSNTSQVRSKVLKAQTKYSGSIYEDERFKKALKIS